MMSLIFCVGMLSGSFMGHPVGVHAASNTLRRHSSKSTTRALLQQLTYQEQRLRTTPTVSSNKSRAEILFNLRGRFIDITPAGLAAVAKTQHPAPDFDLATYVSTPGQASWLETDLSLFGSKNQALVGGLAGAKQVVSLAEFDGGLGAVASSIAANFPDKVASLVLQGATGDNDLVTVNLQFKTADVTGQFTTLPLRVFNTLPIDKKTHKIVGKYQPSISSWPIYVLKAVLNLQFSQSSSQNPLLQGSEDALMQALLGREVRTIGLTRNDDRNNLVANGGSTFPLFNTLPSEDFDLYMENLALSKVGVLRSRGSSGLNAYAEYDPDTQSVKFDDGILVSALNSNAIRVMAKDKSTDIVLHNDLLYSVIEVLKDSQGRPTALRLYNSQGFNYEPSKAMDDAANTAKNLNKIPTVAADFILTIHWAKRVVRSLTA